MTQREWIEELHRLSNEHPEAEIHVCVASDELVLENRYAWTAHEIRRVTYGWWVEDDGEFFTNADEYYEHLHDFLELDVGREEAQEKMVRAILIYTGA